MNWCDIQQLMYFGKRDFFSIFYPLKKLQFGLDDTVYILYRYVNELKSNRTWMKAETE